jgi:septum formation protein
MAPLLVLASASPRRAELLRNLGLSFAIMPSDVEEQFDHSVDPGRLAVEIAQKKAQAVASKLKAELGLTGSGQVVVIGADTIVVKDGNALGKPGSKQEAIKMLSLLSGQVHEVYTGVALIGLPLEEIKTCWSMSKVKFRALEPAEVEAYVETGEPMDKAGSYALQGAGAAFIDSVTGSHTNVIGLPIPPLVTQLRKLGVKVLGL